MGGWHVGTAYPLSAAGRGHGRTHRRGEPQTARRSDPSHRPPRPHGAQTAPENSPTPPRRTRPPISRGVRLPPDEVMLSGPPRAVLWSGARRLVLCCGPGRPRAVLWSGGASARAVLWSGARRLVLCCGSGARRLVLCCGPGRPRAVLWSGARGVRTAPCFLGWVGRPLCLCGGRLVQPPCLSVGVASYCPSCLCGGRLVQPPCLSVGVGRPLCLCGGRLVQPLVSLWGAAALSIVKAVPPAHPPTDRQPDPARGCRAVFGGGLGSVRARRAVGWFGAAGGLWLPSSVRPPVSPSHKLIGGKLCRRASRP